MTNTPPTVVTVPCLSGAPWDLGTLTPLQDLDLLTFRLPDTPDTIEGYADDLTGRIADLDRYVLVADSFGAIVALALAVRRPVGLAGLVVSGGFAADPVTNPVLRAKIKAARWMPGLAYRQLVLRAHAGSLSSPHDQDGQQPWTRADSRRLFADNTPHTAYVTRTRAALAVDVRDRLHRIEVPTLVLTPSHDQLIGADAAATLVGAIPDATEVVLPDTGHMFRFTHPTTYASAIRTFLDRHHLTDPAGTVEAPARSVR